MNDFTMILTVLNRAGIKFQLEEGELETDCPNILVPTKHPDSVPNSVYFSFKPDHTLYSVYSIYPDPDDEEE